MTLEELDRFILVYDELCDCIKIAKKKLARAEHLADALTANVKEYQRKIEQEKGTFDTKPVTDQPVL